MIKHQTQHKSTILIKNYISTGWKKKPFIYRYTCTEERRKLKHIPSISKRKKAFEHDPSPVTMTEEQTSSPLMLRKPTLADRGSSRGQLIKCLSRSSDSPVTDRVIWSLLWLWCGCCGHDRHASVYMYPLYYVT